MKTSLTFPHDPLLTAAEVAAILNVRPKRVYELPIAQVRLSARSIRWRLSDINRWIDSQRSEAA